MAGRTIGRDARVAELCRHPSIGAMASLTGVGAHDVSCCLAGSFNAVVAIRAVTGDAAVIKGRSSPGNRVVAQRAIERGVDVIGRFTNCLHAVVTAGASP